MSHDIELQPTGSTSGFSVQGRNEKNNVFEKRHSVVSVAETLSRGQVEELETVKGFIAEKDLDGNFEAVPVGEGIIPDDDDEVIDPRLKDYPIPLVARTVDLKNDPTEPILTFRFWVLSTFWVLAGCGLSTFYYFKPFSTSITSYAIQLLSWGMGDLMARYLPKREFTFWRWKWSMNPGPWNSKEHALIVVAYWGSCYTAFGLGPLSAMELFFNAKLNAFWSIIFLLSTQMIGYGFSGLYRDILVRPPSMYYPGELPNVALFNTMHKNPSVTRSSIRYFTIVACCAFVYEWFPQVIFPLLGSLPLLCYFGHGHWKTYLLGSGYYGFGILDVSLDWNNISFLQPLYTPLWANLNQGIFAIFLLWFLYPILYFNNVLNAQTFAAFASGTYTSNGSHYDPNQVLTPTFELNRTALEEYGRPYWAPTYIFRFFWGYCAITASMTYAILWYGPMAYRALMDGFKGKRDNYEDPYLKLMEGFPRVPHWWYLTLLAICTAFGIAQLYEGSMQLPAWGFIVIALISFVFTWPNGILWGVANAQVGMGMLGELIAGSLFPGQPIAVLAGTTYASAILEQNLNLISDYKFGFYMKIPEREMFWGQVWGTFLGPFVNYGFMQLVIDNERPYLIGDAYSAAWDAVNSRSSYSTSMIWGILGPKEFFTGEYAWVYYAFAIGPAVTIAVWLVQRMKPKWNLEHWFNPTMIFYGGLLYPVYPSVTLMTSLITACIFMGYVFHYHPVWFRKFNYLTGVGLDCGTQLMTLFAIFIVDLPNFAFPNWWGNNADATDRCFPPSTLPPYAA